MRDIKLSVFLCMHLYIESAFVKKKKEKPAELGHSCVHVHSFTFCRVHQANTFGELVQTPY